MTANVTRLENNKVRLDIEVSPEEVREGVEAKVREFRKQVRVPGFRPGKAPRRMIENHLGRDYIYMEALQDRLPTWYSRAVIDSDIRPIDQPEIHFDEPLDEEEGFKFSATVAVRPEAKLGEYKQLEVPKREALVTDEQVENRIEELRGQFATLAAVENRPVQEGDFVIIDFKGERMSGGEIPGAEAEDFMLEVGRGELLEDFEKNLVGMNAGERKQFGVTFPMDYQEESLRGQSVLFRVHVKEVKERDLPPLDDDFAMEASEFDTLEELRRAIREQLEETTTRQVEGEFRARVLDVVAEKAEVEVPKPMVDDKASEMVRSFERNIEAQGIKPEQYYQISQASREEFAERVRPDAEDTVKKELVLDAVVAAENIEADEEAVRHEMEHLAEDMGRDAEEIAQTMRENGTYALLREEIARRKALDFLTESSIPIPMPEDNEEEMPGAEEDAPGSGKGTVEAKLETGATEQNVTEGEK